MCKDLCWVSFSLTENSMLKVTVQPYKCQCYWTSIGCFYHNWFTDSWCTMTPFFYRFKFYRVLFYSLHFSGLFLCMENWVDPSSSSYDASKIPPVLTGCKETSEHRETWTSPHFVRVNLVCQQKAVDQVIGYSITAGISCCSFLQLPQDVTIETCFTDHAKWTTDKQLIHFQNDLQQSSLSHLMATGN